MSTQRTNVPLLIGSGIAGVIIGLFAGRSGPIVFCVICILAALIYRLYQKVADLENAVLSLKTAAEKKKPLESAEKTFHEPGPEPMPESKQDPKAETVAADISDSTPPTPPPVPEFVYEAHQNPEPSITEPVPAEPLIDGPGSRQTGVDMEEFSTGTSNAISQSIVSFFTTGNLVAKAGVFIFFIGIAFLIKYAADHSMLPVSVRLCFAGISGIVLEIIGFRLRNKRKNYATILQGAGIGIMYLTIFGAARFYHLLPMGPALFLMIAVVIFSTIMAVLQDARSLAFFGVIGGFLSPVLMSTGQGSHVALFSYYLLLNAGIFATAWYKSWRALNWTGFIFTFVIGFLWGYRYYQPEYFATTEPFLVAHFSFYAIISVLFALRQPPKLKGLIDGTLVFALPVVFFGLQSALVHDMPYALAFTCLCMGGFYILLSVLIFKKKDPVLTALLESFTALGVICLSLAIPFAFTASWTTGLWALEGAGLLWIGLRQNRFPALVFGIILQAAAAVSFIFTLNTLHQTPVINGICLSAFFISAGAFASSFFLTRRFWKDKPLKPDYAIFFGIWGFIWWFAGGTYEILTFVPYSFAYQSILVFCSASCMIFSTLNLKFRWDVMAYPLFVLPAVAACMTLYMAFTRFIAHPFENFAWAGFTIYFLTQYHLLFWHEKKWNRSVCGITHQAAFFLGTGLLCWQVMWMVLQITDAGTVWPEIVWVIIPGAFMLFLGRFSKKIKWPMAAFQDHYGSFIPIFLTLFAAVYSLVRLSIHPGTATPLPYVPVFSPADLTQLFVIIIMIKCIQLLREIALPDDLDLVSVMTWATAGIFFLWLNILVTRTIHTFGHIDFTLQDMFDSSLFQTGISILWAVLALTVMSISSRKLWRIPWFTGAALLALVVLKLFVIDLVGIDTFARVITFLVVGILMLVIGYISPLPPKPQQATQRKADHP